MSNRRLHLFAGSLGRLFAWHISLYESSGEWSVWWEWPKDKFRAEEFGTGPGAEAAARAFVTYLLSRAPADVEWQDITSLDRRPN